jgi:hypothetical protein
MSIISDAFRSLFTSKRKDGESLQDYTRRFKTSTEILESHLGGPLILEKYVRTMTGYDKANDSKTDELIKHALESLFAYLYLEDADQDKYGTILNNLNSQNSLGNDQFLRTIVETNKVLSNHKFDVVKKKQENHNTHHPRANPHKNKEKEEESTPLLFAQMKGRCYCCGRPGHKSPDCRNKDKTPRDEWAIHMAQQHAQSNSDAASPSGSTVSSKSKIGEPAIGWAGLHCSFAQTVDMKEMILLDSDSTDTVFCNPKYVSNIRDSEDPLSISTNGGVMKSHQKCDIPHIKDVWYNENSMTNIISLKDMTNKFRVTMDSKEELALLVHMPDKIVKFNQFSDGLYAMDPSDKKSFTVTKKPYQFLNTLEENLGFLSPRQQKRAKIARELSEAMGTPMVDNLKAMIRMNRIKNNVVTAHDVNLATKAYSPDVGAIKGKTTRSKPTPVTSNIVEIPDELLEVQQDLTLSMDGLTVNSLKLLSTTISHDLYYRTAQYIARPVASIYEECMDELLALYKRGGFTISAIHCNNEFRKVMDPLSARQDLPITMNYAATQEHVPRAERNNRVIQERVRAA